MRLLKVLDRWFRPLAFVAALSGLGVALYAERGGIAAYPWRLSWPAFAGAVLLFATAPLAGAAVFWIVLQGMTGRTPFASSARVWMRGFIARYVPSGALTMAVRLRARNRLRATVKEIWRATLAEQLVAAVGGAAASTAAFGLAGDGIPLAAPLLLACGLGAAILVVRRRRALLSATAVACGSWVATGPAAWLIVTAMTPHAPSALSMTGAYAFAWLLGFVVVFAPSGLGVREATLIALLSPDLGIAAATLVAVTLRLASTLGDLLALFVVEAATRQARSSSAGTGSTRSDEGADPVVPHGAGSYRPNVNRRRTA